MPTITTSKEQYLVYGLIDPITKCIRYIGKSVQGLSRINDHWRDSALKEGNTRKISWIKQLKKNNTKYDYCVLFVADYKLNKSEANIVVYKVEQQLIQFYRSIGFDLLNHTDGGPGAPGRQVSEETRKKMSASAKKRPLPVALLEQQKPKGRPLKKSPKTLAEGRPSRAIPGARENFNNRRRMSVKIYNPITKESKIILGLNRAARLIGYKCSKTGIKLAIKKQKLYYGYEWSFV